MRVPPCLPLEPGEKLSCPCEELLSAALWPSVQGGDGRWRVVIFGGRTKAGIPLNDAWEATLELGESFRARYCLGTALLIMLSHVGTAE